MAGTRKEALTEEEEKVMKSCGDEVSYRLTEERRARLESIGFVWNIREGEKGADANRITRNSYDDQWDAMFERLRAANARSASNARGANVDGRTAARDKAIRTTLAASKKDATSANIIENASARRVTLSPGRM